MGHNNASLNSTGSIEYPPGQGIYSRIDREWKITNTNFNGTFSIDVKLNTAPITASDLRILVDTDGNFTNAIMYNPSISFSGGIVTISGVSTSEIPLNSTRYFTLVSLNSNTPLPIQLISFSATPTDEKQILLEWQTASEINNDYFTIERSVNGLDWQELRKIHGAENSSSTLSYEVYDENPYAGISFYRLKQTDVNGQFSYSEIRDVTIDRFENSQIEIYPNPTNNDINIEGNHSELKQLKIYNVLGHDVTALTKQISGSDSKLIIDLSSLNAGMYYIKTKTTANKVYKQ